METTRRKGEDPKTILQRRKNKKEIAETMKLSVNTIKSWIRRSRLENFSKENTDDQINDKIKLIEGNSKTRNRTKIDRKTLRN